VCELCHEPAWRLAQPRSSSMLELRRLLTGLEARKLHVGVAACGTLVVILVCSLLRAFGGLHEGTRSFEQ
jgi:hypothetical protein